MEIKTLSSILKDEVFEAFKLAFDNYVIPVEIKKETTLSRWETAGVKFKLSYGVFDDSKLVAFVLHTKCGDTLFNFATGVIPSHRGKHLVENIYAVVEKDVKDFKTFSLEVICENTRAFNLYKKLGFTISRELISLKGKFGLNVEKNKSLEYRVIPLRYTEDMRRIQLAHPSLENAPITLSERASLHEVHELREKGELLAYAIFTPETLSIREMGATFSYEILDQLLLNMKLNSEEIRIMNIDANSSELLLYLEQRGLTRFVAQYEMTKDAPTFYK
jgi:hypothetical protein